MNYGALIQKNRLKNKQTNKIIIIYYLNDWNGDTKVKFYFLFYYYDDDIEIVCKIVKCNVEKNTLSEPESSVWTDGGPCAGKTNWNKKVNLIT